MAIVFRPFYGDPPAAEAIFIVPPQRHWPRAGCARCDQGLIRSRPWLIVWPFTRTDGFQAAVVTPDPYQGSALCEECAQTGWGVHLVAADAPASGGEYWGAAILSEAMRVRGTHQGFARR